MMTNSRLTRLAPLFALLGCVAILWAVWSALDYFSTPVSYRVSSMEAASPGPLPVTAAHRRLGMSPFVETHAVKLDPKVVDVLKHYGLRQVGAQPVPARGRLGMYGSSSTMFYPVVNRKPYPNAYSTIRSFDDMYYVDVSGDTPRVWVTQKALDAQSLFDTTTRINNELLHYAHMVDTGKS